jgi:hypothetical protein
MVGDQGSARRESRRPIESMTGGGGGGGGGGPPWGGGGGGGGGGCGGGGGASLPARPAPAAARRLRSTNRASDFTPVWKDADAGTTSRLDHRSRDCRTLLERCASSTGILDRGVTRECNWRLGGTAERRARSWRTTLAPASVARGSSRPRRSTLATFVSASRTRWAMPPARQRGSRRAQRNYQGPQPRARLARPNRARVERSMTRTRRSPSRSRRTAVLPTDPPPVAPSYTYVGGESGRLSTVRQLEPQTTNTAITMPIALAMVLRHVLSIGSVEAILQPAHLAARSGRAVRQSAKARGSSSVPRTGLVA